MHVVCCDIFNLRPGCSADGGRRPANTRRSVTVIDKLRAGPEDVITLVHMAASHLHRAQTIRELPPTSDMTKEENIPSCFLFSDLKFPPERSWMNCGPVSSDTDYKR